MYEFRSFYENIKDKKIIVFGAGDKGVALVEMLSLYDNVICFLDNSDRLIKAGISVGNNRKYNVYRPAELSDHLQPDTVIVISTAIYEKDMYQQIEQQAAEKNVPVLFISKVRDIDFQALKRYRIRTVNNNVDKSKIEPLLLDKMNYVFGYKTETKPFVAPAFNLHVTTQCNLKCRHCRPLMPYMKNTSHVPLEEFKKEIDILSSSVDQIITVAISGGEAFLHPQLAEALEYALSKDNILFFGITTNGTIIPDEKVLKLLADNSDRVRVLLSDYGLLDKMASLIVLLEKHKINFVVKTDYSWYECSGPVDNKRDVKTSKELFNTCKEIGCAVNFTVVHQFKLWICPRAMAFSNMGTDIELSKDCREISEKMDSNTIREQLLSLYSEDYASSCNFCDLNSLPLRTVTPAIQISGSIPRSEYTIVKRSKYEALIEKSNNCSC